MVEVGANTVDGAMADITVGVTMDITETGDIGARGVMAVVVAGIFAAVTVGVGAGAIVVACGTMAASNNRFPNHHPPAKAGGFWLRSVKAVTLAMPGMLSRMARRSASCASLAMRAAISSSMATI